jgi:hypothetical protein
MGHAGTVAGRCSDALAAELALTPAPARMVSLNVRPERMRLLGPHEAAGDALNPWPATVVDLVHQGDHWRLIAQLAGTDNAAPWLVKLPAGAATAGLAPGAAVTLGFAPQDAWVF